jgi:hypothetical protein
MNSTSCPRRFGWIETNWCRRIDLSSTVQLNASGRSSSFPVSESMSLSKHRADLDLYLLMRNLRAWSDSQIATLYPGCFALVDSAVAALWYLEARRLPCTPDIHADVLESGVPARYVALASLRLSLAADFSPLRAISASMVWVALAAWAATSAGLVTASWHSFREFERSSSL